MRNAPKPRIDDDAGLRHQGDKLVQDGHDLIEDGQEVYENVYGRPNAIPYILKVNTDPMTVPKRMTTTTNPILEWVSKRMRWSLTKDLRPRTLRNPSRGCLGVVVGGMETTTASLLDLSTKRS